MKVAIAGAGLGGIPGSDFTVASAEWSGSHDPASAGPLASTGPPLWEPPAATLSSPLLSSSAGSWASTPTSNTRMVSWPDITMTCSLTVRDESDPAPGSMLTAGCGRRQPTPSAFGARSPASRSPAAQRPPARHSSPSPGQGAAAGAAARRQRSRSGSARLARPGATRDPPPPEPPAGAGRAERRWVAGHARAGTPGAGAARCSPLLAPSSLPPFPSFCYLDFFSCCVMSIIYAKRFAACCTSRASRRGRRSGKGGGSGKLRAARGGG